MKPHTLFTMSGTLTPDLQEIWTCTLRILGGVPGAATSPIPDGNLQTYLNEVAVTVGAWFSGVTNYIPNTVKLKTLKANNIGPDGKYTSDTTHYFDYVTPIAGNASGSPLDIINSVVGTFTTTDRTRGPASRGRMYLPNFGASHNAGTGKTTSGNQTAIRASYVSLLNAIRNAAGTVQAAPVLISTVNDQFSYINAISVDDVIDVQRRRKNNLVGTRIGINWP